MSLSWLIQVLSQSGVRVHFKNWAEQENIKVSDLFKHFDFLESSDQFWLLCSWFPSDFIVDFSPYLVMTTVFSWFTFLTWQLSCLLFYSASTTPLLLFYLLHTLTVVSCTMLLILSSLKYILACFFITMWHSSQALV